MILGSFHLESSANMVRAEAFYQSYSFCGLTEISLILARLLLLLFQVSQV